MNHAEKLAEALDKLMPHAVPFMSKPVGAPNSLARAEQTAHIAAYEAAHAALTDYRRTRA